MNNNNSIIEQVMKINDPNPHIIDIIYEDYLYKLVLNQRTIIGYLSNDNQEVKFSNNDNSFYIEPFERISSQ